MNRLRVMAGLVASLLLVLAAATAGVCALTCVDPAATPRLTNCSGDPPLDVVLGAGCACDDSLRTVRISCAARVTGAAFDLQSSNEATCGTATTWFDQAGSGSACFQFGPPRAPSLTVATATRRSSATGDIRRTAPWDNIDPQARLVQAVSKGSRWRSRSSRT
jgi:hypothetical protein